MTCLMSQMITRKKYISAIMSWKTYKSFFQYQTSFLHPHSTLFDQSWENKLLEGQIKSILKTKGIFGSTG